MINYDEANEVIRNEFSRLLLKTEYVDILDGVDRILAGDIVSDTDLPPFTNSAMDGFALRYSEGITKWKIIGEISAGNYSNFDVGSGLAVGIMTGGRMPSQADTVIPVEDVIIENDSVRLKENGRMKKGANVRLKGSDLQKGSVALEKHTLLKPRHIAVAASCGAAKLKVFKRLKIGVLATGDELIDIEDRPDDDKIRTSNLYALLAAVSEINHEGFNLGVVRDNETDVTEKINSFLNSDLDILITTGGVSVGKYDYVKSVMENLGIKINFWKANIKPGKPVVFGTYSKNDVTKFVFGLPGNPVSCLVNFMIFAANNIREAFGIDADNSFKAVLTEGIKKKDGKRHFIRGLYSKSPDGEITVRRVGSQSSGNLADMGKSNCLIIFDEDKNELTSGEKVICIPM